MRLTPLQPPGRITRKARAYEADIARLRSQGYTLEAIRQALADAGIDVSLSTVWREALRSRNGSAPAVAAPQSAARTGARAAPREPREPREISFLELPTADDPVPCPPAALPDACLERSPTPRSGKDIAEAFRLSESNNPFIRASRSTRPKESS